VAVEAEDEAAGDADAAALSPDLVLALSDDDEAWRESVR
jgi:hypothetical protein